MGVRMCVRMCAVASSLHREVGARFDARAVRERHRSRRSRRASRNRAERGRQGARVAIDRSVPFAERVERFARGRTAVSSVSRSSGKTSRMLQYGSSSRVGRGFSNGSRMTCGRSSEGWGCQRGVAEAERPRGEPERNDSLTGGVGGRATRRSLSPPKPLPRVPCRARRRSSPRAGRAATSSSPAPSRDTSTHARRTVVVAVRETRTGREARSRFGLQLTEAARPRRSSAISAVWKFGACFQIGT